MPKMRGFKAEIWTDEKFVELDPLARLMFMGMWSYACDNGHLDDRPKQIKMRVLPTDEVDPVVLIDQMVDLGMVIRDDATEILTVPKLREHQRIDDRYFTWCEQCALDDIPERSRERYLSATQGTRSAPTVSTSGSRSAHAMKEGRKEGEGEGEGSAAGKPAKRATALPDTFRPNDKHQALAAELGVNLQREWAKFTDHARAKGVTYKDWNAALNNWIRRAAEYGGNVQPLRTQPDDQGRIALPPLPTSNPWGN